MVSMNVFRILADVSHTLSKCILIYAIHRNRSAEGVSLITQVLYAVVFITRYLDLFPVYSLWNFVLKIFYMASSLYIIFLMLRVYARTREREKAWKFGGFCLGGSALAAPFVMMIFRDKERWSFMELLWVFSIILESVCVLPQLLLLRQTTVPTVIDSFYLLMLGSYRGFYILNWIWRDFHIDDRKPDVISVIFGVIQTAFYIDFAWVYYTRQRVKLRNGGVVDGDDMRRGWLLTRVLGHKIVSGGEEDDDGDEESHLTLGSNGATRPSRPLRNGSNVKWGPRGISISADDGVLESERERDLGLGEQETGVMGVDVDADAKMRDPDELAKILDDDNDEDGSDDGILPAGAHESGGSSSSSRVGNGSEWRK